LYYQMPGMDKSIPMPSLTNRTNQELLADVTAMNNRLTGGGETPAGGGKPASTQVAPPAAPAAPAEGTGETPTEGKTTTDFIRANVAPATLEPTKSRIERIKEAKAEYAPLYKELLGDTKDDMQTNALLLLADAGFKYAQLPAGRGTTPASLFATAVSGMPQGFMALLAQARDNKIKVDTAALSQAVDDVQEQDKYAQQLKMEVLQGRLSFIGRTDQARRPVCWKMAGAGVVVAEQPRTAAIKACRLTRTIQTVQSALSSPWTLRPTDNPFVENRGQAPATVETNKDERTKLTSTLRGIDNTLKAMDNAEGLYVQEHTAPAHGSRARWNNLLVPIVPSAVTKSGLDQVAAANQLRTVVNTAMKSLAAANNEGRVAVQEQEWAQPICLRWRILKTSSRTRRLRPRPSPT